MQLGAEAGLRVQGLVGASETLASRGRGKGKEKGKDVGGEGSGKEMDRQVREWLWRLRSLNSLWMAPGLYRTLFHAMPEDARFDRVQGGCEACILAFVGGNVQAILDLRTSLIGRKKKGYESRLWGLVDAWTRRCREADCEWIREESERVGRLVMKERRRARRRRRRARRERRRGGKGGNKTEIEIEIETETAGVGGRDGADDVDDEPEDEIGDVAPRDGKGQGEAEEHDFEGSIIDFYLDLASKSNLAVNMQQNPNAAQVNEDVLHPAFRDSAVYSPISGTFRRRPQ
jgi:hypothetical protein